MEALARSIELGAGSGDEITSKEEPGTAEQSLEENISSPEFSPHWGSTWHSPLFVLSHLRYVFYDCLQFLDRRLYVPHILFSKK
jgi:hypothetical protein